MAITTRNRKQGKTTPTTAVAPTSGDASGTKRNNGHSKPLPAPAGLSDLARIRIGHLQTLMGCSHSQLYVKLKSGAIPPADGRDGKRPYWKVATIRALLEG